MSQSFDIVLWKDIATGIAITCCILAISVLMPIIGFFISMLIPLPVLFYRAKLGRKNGIIVPVVTSILLLIMVGRLSIDVFYLLELMMLGFILYEMYEMQLPVEKTVAYASLTVIGLSFAVILLYSSFSGLGLVEMLTSYVSQNLDLTLAWYKSRGASEEQLAVITEFFNGMKLYFVRIFPALIVVSTLMVTWANIVISRPMLKSKSLLFADYGSLNRWKSPEALIWVLIGSGFLLLMPGAGFKTIGINFLLVLLTVYFLQGIAVVSFFFEKKRFPRFVRIILYIFISMQQLLWLLVIGFGIFDIWLDFRKIAPADPDTEK